MTEKAAPTSGKDVIASLAGQMRHADAGTMARLRRHDPSRSPHAAVFQAERLLGHADAPVTEQNRSRWALLLHCLALAEGRHDARDDAEPGGVLHRLNVSEARIAQLIEADWPLLQTLLPRLARRIAAQSATINWWPFADLLLGTGIDDPHRQQRADVARQRIVRRYVEAQAKAAPHSAPD